MEELLLRFGAVNLWRILKLMKLFILILFVEMWLDFIIVSKIVQIKLKIFKPSLEFMGELCPLIEKVVTFLEVSQNLERNFYFLLSSF
jgi:hypothetical protein